VVVGGECGITTAMFNSGYNIATLMSKYAKVGCCSSCSSPELRGYCIDVV